MTGPAKYDLLLFLPKFGGFPAGSIWISQGQCIQFTGVTSFPVDRRGSVLDLRVDNYWCVMWPYLKGPLEGATSTSA